MNVDIKQIDLNGLFQFELLKQIILNLADSQENIKKELNNINESNKIRDEKIARLESVDKIGSNIYDNQLININQSVEIDNINNKNKESDIENITDNKDENINKEENKNEKDIMEEKKEDINKIEHPELSEMLKIKKDENINKHEKIDNDLKEEKNNISNEIYLTMIKGNREQNEKIINLEKKLMNQIEFQIKRIKEDYIKQISYLSQENKTSFQKIDEHINSISQKDKEQDEKIEDCFLKCNSFDIFNMIKDSGDGSVDLAKILVKTLEEKVFKKFELIDKKHKLESMEIMKVTKIGENINNKMDLMERNFNEIKENEIKQIKEDIENNKKNNDKKMDEISSILHDKEINLVKKISQTEKNLLKIFKEKELNFDKNYQKIYEKSKNDENIKDNKTQNIDIYSDKIETLERRINDLRTKTNNIDSSLKYLMKDWNIEALQKNIKDIQVDLEKKITKDNLKELYNLHFSDLEEINDLREHASYINDDLKKTIKNVSALAPKVENLMGHILFIKQNNKNIKIPQIDTSRYIDNIKFNEGMNQLLNKINNIMREVDSLRRDLNDVKDDQQLFEKKDRVDRLEEEIEKKIDVNLTKIHKNKNEINKVSKALEVEVKSIWNEFKRKEQAESWLLAKQPMKCFNCATCENNIKNQVPKEEVIHWNKYPENDKNYRLGKGFSHMLEMMTYQLINNVENNKDNEYIPINEESNQNNLNFSSNNINEESNVAQIGRSSSDTRFKKRSAKENQRTIFSINSGRVRLPQVYDFSKKKINIENFKNINSSLSVYEKNDIDLYKKGKIQRNDSPTIIKITKKKEANQILAETNRKRLIKSDILNMKND